MDSTLVNAQFILVGRNFNPNFISDCLSLEANEFGIEGEDTQFPNLVHKESFWQIQTGYQESYDVNEQLNQLVYRIEPVKSQLRLLITDLNLRAEFSIVIKIENGEKPAIYLTKSMIGLLYEIPAEIDFDIYILS